MLLVGVIHWPMEIKVRKCGLISLKKFDMAECYWPYENSVLLTTKELKLENVYSLDYKYK